MLYYLSDHYCDADQAVIGQLLTEKDGLHLWRAYIFLEDRQSGRFLSEHESFSWKLLVYQCLFKRFHKIMKSDYYL